MSENKSEVKEKKHSHRRHRKHHSTSKVILSIASESAPTYYVEAFKMIASNIEFISVAQECKSILVTSTVQDEGKTNLAVNLAIALAGYGKRVCLVDCDLRRPSVHRLQRGSSGLTNVLKGENTLEEAIFKHDESSLDILLGGTIPPNPTELLASAKMQKIIERLKEMYDYVIYDTPPCLGISDVSVLGKYMDGAVLAIRHDSTDKRIVERAKGNIENAGVKILGAILMEYRADSDVSNSYYYKYGYKYGGYYYGYGAKEE
ncbi:MAG: CpsD/CapB family tyrosine-protein kinase [Clostridia bacterium]|nr:CpsD/CapB family tyrosine-protein kinase [Clostridia bacterium]